MNGGRRESTSKALVPLSIKSSFVNTPNVRSPIPNCNKILVSNRKQTF